MDERHRGCNEGDGGGYEVCQMNSRTCNRFISMYRATKAV